MAAITFTNWVPHENSAAVRTAIPLVSNNNSKIYTNKDLQIYGELQIEMGTSIFRSPIAEL